MRSDVCGDSLRNVMMKASFMLLGMSNLRFDNQMFTDSNRISH